MATFAVHSRQTRTTKRLSMLLAQAGFLSGMNVFALNPEQERDGFPSSSFVRMDKTALLSKEIPGAFDIILVMDATIEPEVYRKTHKDSIIIINSAKKAKAKDVTAIDAAAIAMEAAKKDASLAVMFGAAVKAHGKISIKNAKAAMENLGEKENAAFEAGYKAMK